MSDTSSASFQIQRVYLKDLSFESPAAPNIFRSQHKPDIKLDLNTATQKLEDGIHEVVLRLTVTAQHQEQSLFLIEVQQAGIFQLRGFEPAAIAQMIGSLCPGILFPYAREVIDSVLTKGSFPALMLAPINFDALYQAAQQEAKTAETH